jgi:CHAT domain-containing protein
MQLDQQQPGKGFAAQALLVSERARARSLAELVLKQQKRRSDEPGQSLVLSIDRLQAQLHDGNTLLLEYALGDERSYVWAATENSVKGYVLPAKASLEQSARAVYEALTMRQPTDLGIDESYQSRVIAADKKYEEEAMKLSRMLLEPVAHELGNKRLIIVAEGALQHVPFEALPIPGKRSSDSLLISQHEVVSLPSMSVLAAIRSTNGRHLSQTNAIAVFADPVFDGRGWIRLTHSLEEADEIARAAPASTLIANGFAASRENVLEERLAQYRIVHFATHGFIDTQHPERSGIVLSMAKPDGTPENGYLQLNDIYNLKLSADLTVLSACDTALGKDMQGEGLIGLTRGFMSAGSKSVVASLWKVDDRATAALMKHFYDMMLHDGMPPAAALRSAKEIVRRQPGWSAPYYWAGFVLQGEYLDRIQLDDERSVQPLGSFLSALLIATLIFIQHRRRRGQIDREHA